jgi:cobalamin biosynthesis protein CobD/CbiB
VVCPILLLPLGPVFVLVLLRSAVDGQSLVDGSVVILAVDIAEDIPNQRRKVDYITGKDAEPLPQVETSFNGSIGLGQNDRESFENGPTFQLEN